MSSAGVNAIYLARSAPRPGDPVLNLDDPVLNTGWPLISCLILGKMWSLIFFHLYMRKNWYSSHRSNVTTCYLIQWLLTLCKPMDCSMPDSSVHGISQARLLEQVVISFSRRSSETRDWISVSHVSCITDRLFAFEAPGMFCHMENAY